MEVMTETDLDWAVIVEGESAEEFSCERAGECDNEAVYTALWMPENENAEGLPVDPCACGPHSYDICIECYDLFCQIDGLAWCARCSPSGPHLFKTIVSVQPIRRFS